MHRRGSDIEDPKNKFMSDNPTEKSRSNNYRLSDLLSEVPSSDYL